MSLLPAVLASVVASLLSSDRGDTQETRPPKAPIETAARTGGKDDSTTRRDRSGTSRDGVEIARRWTFDSAEDARGWEAGEGVADLRVEKGRLVGRIERADAYVFAPPVRLPVEGLVVKVRWSSPRGGNGQCYYATDLSPAMGEDKVISKRVRGGGDMVETSFPIPAGDRDRSPLLTRFRLDPFNGVEGVSFEIDEVALVWLPSRLEIGFGPVESVVDVDEEVSFKVSLRHLGGRRPRGVVEATIEQPEDLDARIVVNAGDEDPEGSCVLRFRRRGVHVVQANVRREGRLTHVLDAGIIVGGASHPNGPLVESRGVGIELLPSASEPKAMSAGRLWIRHGNDWRDGGLLLPLVELVVEEGGAVRRAQPAMRVLERSDRGFLLAPHRTEWSAWRPEITLGFEDPAEKSARRGRANDRPTRDIIRLRSTLRGPPGGRLLKYTGVRVRRLAGRTDPLARHGLFGGVEFLAPGERSSSHKAIGPKFAERWTPHPFKICLPVMAIEQESVTTAVLWNPLEEWASGHAMPAATFASTDFLGGRTDHVLEVFAPSVGDFVDENGTMATRPFVISGDDRVQLTTTLHLGWKEPVIRTARLWYETFGVPEAPPAPHDMKATYDLIARCYGETVYWPEDKGWRHHWFLDTSSRHRPDMAAELLLHARETGEQRWIDATGLEKGASVIRTAGTLWNRALGSTRGAEGAVRRLRDDGTYAYHDSPSARDATRRHTGGRFDTLGEEGSTSLGTCVQGLQPLLRHVLLTASAEYVQPLEKALRALRRFRVPRGAQVWEVHKDIPDIRAAALAVEAYRIGYLVSGDASYLDDALYWAETGLAFLFTWRTPHDPEPATVRTSRDREDASAKRAFPAGELFRDPWRRVNPYGTIPVLGTTFYVIPWFGVIVQWCGLEWAWKVLELCDVRDDPLLRAVAEGVIRSGLQQTFDRPPWTGLYPDVWNLEGNWAGGALICPHLTVQALRAAGHLPQALRRWTRRVGSAPTARIVNGWGEVVSCEVSSRESGERLVVVLRFPENEPGELLVARSERPHCVEVAGERLGERSAEAGSGWVYDAERKLLGVRFTAREREIPISIEYR